MQHAAAEHAAPACLNRTDKLHNMYKLAHSWLLSETHLGVAFVSPQKQDSTQIQGATHCLGGRCTHNVLVFDIITQGKWVGWWPSNVSSLNAYHGVRWSAPQRCTQPDDQDTCKCQ